MAMGGHGFREGTACACLADDRSRHLSGNTPATSPLTVPLVGSHLIYLELSSYFLTLHVRS